MLYKVARLTCSSPCSRQPHSHSVHHLTGFSSTCSPPLGVSVGALVGSGGLLTPGVYTLGGGVLGRGRSNGSGGGGCLNPSCVGVKPSAKGETSVSLTKSEADEALASGSANGSAAFERRSGPGVGDLEPPGLFGCWSKSSIRTAPASSSEVLSARWASDRREGHIEPRMDERRVDPGSGVTKVVEVELLLGGDETRVEVVEVDEDAREDTRACFRR